MKAFVAPFKKGRKASGGPAASGADEGLESSSVPLLSGAAYLCELPPSPPSTSSPHFNLGQDSRWASASRLERGVFPPSPASIEETPDEYFFNTNKKPPPSFFSTAKKSYSCSQSRAEASLQSFANGSAGVNGHPRLSRAIPLMRNSYDFIVIGSGYGGGIAASRLARSQGPDGRNSVCILERGSEKWPGEYPSTPTSSLSQVRCSGVLDPGNARHFKIPIKGGNPNGLYHIHMGKGLSCFMGNGLGGTSLINANVFLPADKGVLSLPTWPTEIREDPESLNQYYDKVAAVLEPETYPASWPKLHKVELLKRQARLMGMGDKFRKVPQTTRFNNGPNACGVEMRASTLSGEDITGINDGSKNTTLVTYIADAWNWGAEIFCECEVRYILECTGPEGGYIVYYAWRDFGRTHFRDAFKGDLMWVHAKKGVFFGAGAIGTTEILLRSREMGLPLSDHIGQEVSGNGDMLAFGYNTDFESNSLGQARPNPENPTGPTINSAIDNREGHNSPLDGWILEEGAVSSPMVPFLQAMLELVPSGVHSEPKRSMTKSLRSGLASLGSWMLGPYSKRGAMNKTQIYLVMTHDGAQARMTLEDDKLSLDFPGLSRSGHVAKIHELLAQATSLIGGSVTTHPFYSLLGKQQVTVHPLGGARMAYDGTGMTGACNHAGELFTGQGSDVHSGLIVADAAIVPTSLGVNPLATISALAERSIDIFAKKHGLTISEEKNGTLDLFGEPRHPFMGKASQMQTAVMEQKEVIRTQTAMRLFDEDKSNGYAFTEIMSGYIHRLNNTKLMEDDLDTYRVAHRVAKGRLEAARFFLTVQTFDIRSYVGNIEHPAIMTGTVACPTLPGSPFMVQRGDFQLLSVDPKRPNTLNLVYDFDMWGTDRQMLHFHGYKILDPSVELSPIRFWKASSTLYVTITRPTPGRIRNKDDPNDWRHDPVVAKGILDIKLGDFASEVLSLTPSGSSVLRKLSSSLAYFRFMTSHSFPLFLGRFGRLQYPTPSYIGYINRTLPQASFTLTARDGVKTPLYVFEPTNPSIKTRNVVMIAGAAVDHQVFALPTIPYNTVNYMTRAGYRVFAGVHRFGLVSIARDDWTVYDAREDIRAVIQFVRENYAEDNSPDNKVYIVAHCMGSVSFSIGLLTGDIPSEWIWGISCSQTFMTPLWSPPNMIKAIKGPIPLDTLYKKLAGNWMSCQPSTSDSFVHRALSQLLRLYPQPRQELCNNAACHRTSLAFGRCWNHRNLNEATHRQIDRFFNGVNMTLMDVLMRQGTIGSVTTNGPDYTPLVTDENVEKLRGIPILQFVGAENAVLSPAATQRSHDILVKRFGLASEDGQVQYRRLEIPNYGHLDSWMGRNSWRDVYPHVRAEMDRVTRGPEYSFVEPADRFAAMTANGVLMD
ncbi:hypothetical protein BROUX41_000796 [Berkeleyomyces rouxiae]|uniref:uncharacterized protein n=1 Tax=Berkeleyomyces rouxiae TaxID=2035830 RepID=UPI003B7FE72E